MAYTILSGDPRAVGTGNPPADVNNLNDVAAGMGATFNVLNTAYAGGADPTGATSSSAAIQAAIYAALAVAVNQFDNGPMRGPTVIIPFGNYLITTPLTFGGYSEAGIRITGTSRGARLFSTGSTIFDFGLLYMEGFEFDHLTIDATGGHCFVNSALKFAWFHDLDLVQNSPNYSIWDMTANYTQYQAVELQNTTFADIRFWVFPDSSGNRSVPAWNILERTSQGGGDFFAENWFVRINGFNQPNSAGNYDNSQYMFYIACPQGDPTGGSSAYAGGYISTLIFRDMSLHYCLGGGVHVQSGSHIVFDGVSFYDVPTLGTTLLRNITSSLLLVDNYPSTGSLSRGIEFRGVTRSQGELTTIGTGTAGSDIEVSAGVSDVLVHGWSWTGWNANNTQGQINLNGALHCVLIAIDGGTTVLNPAADTIIMSAGVVSLGNVPFAQAPVQSSSSSTGGSGSTITTAGVGVARVFPSGNITGIILQAGTAGGQQVVVINEGTYGAGYTVTFAASSTSHVADGVADVLPGGSSRAFTWDSSTAMWYRNDANFGAGATSTGYTAPAVIALADASTIAVNAYLGNDFRVTLGGNRQLGNPTFTGGSNTLQDGQRILVQVTQDGTGSRLLTYGSAYLFSAGLPSPTLTTTPGYTDLLGFIYNASLGKWLFAAYINGYA